MYANRFLAVVLVLALAATAIPFAMVADDSSADYQSGETYKVTLYEGQAYSYKPALTISDVTIEISGNAVEAFGMTVKDGTISGTAPNVEGSANYNLTIKATTEKPRQEAYQYIQFMVSDLLTITGPQTVITYDGGTVSLDYDSNYEGNGAKYSAQDLPDGLTLNEDTGVISGIAALPSINEQYPVYNAKFVVKVEHLDSGQIDLAGTSKELTVDYTVYPEITVVTTLDDDIFYVVNGKDVKNLDPSDALGFNLNIRNAVFSADLAAAGITGITMDSTGVFSGIPTFMGEKSLTITVTDPNNAGNSTQITITIIAVANLDFDSIPTGGIIVTPSEV